MIHNLNYFDHSGDDERVYLLLMDDMLLLLCLNYKN